MSRWPGIDPFLAHLPDSKRPPSGTRSGTRTFRGGAFATTSTGRETTLESLPIPALVRLPNTRYDISNIEDFEETSRLGSVLSGRGTKEALQRLGRLPGVIVEVSRDGGSWELDNSVDVVKARDVLAPGTDEEEDQCIVGIIDGGIDPLHLAFLDRRGRTRIRYIWDQTASGGSTPKSAGFPFDYGVLYSEDAINAALDPSRDLRLPPIGGEEERLHGTHVASIAAGRRTVSPEGQPAFAGGMAPDAPIIFVVPALRRLDAERPSQGFAKSHIDALSFIARVADNLKLPAVVNVSAGIAAGAHDGCSTLEAGFDAFTEGGHAPGRAIVKSAGNARNARRYARLMLANGGKQTVTMEAAPLSNGASIVEVWFSSAHDLELSVAYGEYLASAPLSARNPRLSYNTEQGVVELSYERFHRDNGDSLILLSVPPLGDTALNLVFRGNTVRGQGEIDVWIEGDSTLDPPTPQRTLTMPGSARTVITVASCERDGEQIAHSSSHGPTRDGRHKPELFAPGVGIKAAAAGTRFGTVSKSGTSMAAPHVTGAIALLFSRQIRSNRMLPNAAQTSAALIATATAMNGVWQTDRGYGLLNVEQLLAAFS